MAVTRRERRRCRRRHEGNRRRFRLTRSGNRQVRESGRRRLGSDHGIDRERDERRGVTEVDRRGEREFDPNVNQRPR